MTQQSTNSSFFRQTNQVERGANVADANSVEFITGNPPALTTNPKRIWVDQVTELLKYTVDGVNIHSVQMSLGVINVKDVGAIGDGVANDTAAIQNAINNTAGIQTIIFPQGTYRITAPITANGKELHLIGFGNAAIQEAAPLNAAMLQFTNCHNSTVSNLSCLGAETLAGFAGASNKNYSFITWTTSNNVYVSRSVITNKTYGLIFQDCNNCAVDDMDIVGFLVTGSLGTNGANFSAGVFFNGGKGNTFSHSHVKDMGSGALVGTGNTSPNYHVINHLWIENARDNGVYISSGDNCTVSNVNVDSVPNNAGVKARGSFHTIIGCNIKNSGLIGISLTGNGSTPDSLGFNGHGTRCIGNSVETATFGGIEVNVQDGFYPRDFIIDGNVLYNTGDNDVNHAAIRVIQGQGHSITNNIIDGSLSPYCILVQGLSSVARMKLISVSGNVIRNGVQGIRSTFIDNSVISNNQFDLLSSTAIECRFTSNSHLVGNQYLGGVCISATAGNTNVGNIIDSNLGGNQTYDRNNNYVANNTPYVTNYETSVAVTPFYRGQIAIVGSSTIYMAATNTVAGDWKQISN